MSTVIGASEELSGRPIRAEMHYSPLRPNHHAEHIPFYDSSYEGFRPFVTSGDGSYRLVGLPGPGLVSLKTLDDYPVDPSAQEITVMIESKKRMEISFPGRLVPHKNYSTAIKQIDPQEKISQFTCDFELKAKPSK